MAPNPLVVGAPSYGALPGRMRCGPYGGEERPLQEVPAPHAAARRLAFACFRSNLQLTGVSTGSCAHLAVSQNLPLSPQNIAQIQRHTH